MKNNAKLANTPQVINTDANAVSPVLMLSLEELNTCNHIVQSGAKKPLATLPVQALLQRLAEAVVGQLCQGHPLPTAAQIDDDDWYDAHFFEEYARTGRQVAISILAHKSAYLIDLASIHTPPRFYVLNDKDKDALIDIVRYGIKRQVYCEPVLRLLKRFAHIITNDGKTDNHCHDGQPIAMTIFPLNQMELALAQ